MTENNPNDVNHGEETVRPENSGGEKTVIVTGIESLPDIEATTSIKMQPKDDGGGLGTMPTIPQFTGSGDAPVVDEEMRGIAVELIGLLGKGGQGEVWEAKQLSLERTIAVKRALAGETTQMEFIREAFTAGHLEHPNIVPIYDLGIEKEAGEPRFQLAMKKIEGKSWAELIKEDRKSEKFSLDSFLNKHIPILIDVINAVAFAHSRGIIHRDLKPTQVMVGEFGEVYLLDWGLAVFVGDLRDGKTHLLGIDPERVYTRSTATNPAGSPAFMAPEQAKFETDQLGVQTDVYLIGGILYYLIRGRPPHDASGVKQAIYQAGENIIAPLPEETPGLLTELLDKCLATQPEDRPKSVLEIRTALEDFLTGASRKSESVKKTGAIRSSLDGLDGYNKISEAMRELSQAASLWPENPAVSPLRDELLQKFVDEAVAQNDFMVAELQADRISSEPLSQECRERVDAERDRSQRELPQPPLFTKSRIAFLAFAWITVFVILYLVVKSGEDTILKEARGTAESLARVISRDLSPADLMVVNNEREIYTTSFQRVFNQLHFYKRANEQIRFVYTMTPEFVLGDHNWRTLVSSDPIDLDFDGDGSISPEEAGSPPGLLVEEAPASMREAFLQSGPASEVHSTSKGTFVAGFAPVLDPRTGEPFALVGVEIPTEGVVQRSENFLLIAVVSCIGFLVLLSAAMIAWFASRRSLARVQQLQMLIQKQNAEFRREDLFLG